MQSCPFLQQVNTFHLKCQISPEALLPQKARFQSNLPASCLGAAIGRRCPQLTLSPLSPGTPRERKRPGERLALTIRPRNTTSE